MLRLVVALPVVFVASVLYACCLISGKSSKDEEDHGWKGK